MTIRLPSPGSAIRGLIVANIVAYVLFLLALRFVGQDVFSVLALTPADFFQGAIWQAFTAVLIHSPVSVGHLGSNLLWLWLFGSEVEANRGARYALRTYAMGGLAGSAVTLLYASVVHAIAPDSGLGTAWFTPSLGASGAVMALTACWGGLFWDEVRHFFLLGAMRVRTFMFILIGFEMLVALSFDNVSSTAHFAGLGVGLLYGRGYLGTGWLSRLRRRRDLERRRQETEEALRRFTVHQGGRSRNQDDEWIN